MAYNRFEILTPSGDVLKKFKDEEIAKKSFQELCGLVECKLIFHSYRK